MLEEELSKRVIGAFFDVYRRTGFGFSEPIYANALAVELSFCGIALRREVPIEVVYRGVAVGAYRLDMIVEDRIIIEIKATKGLTDADERQLLSYLKATKFEVGLLLNFGPEGKFKRLVYSNARK